ncbi:hypothetical protein GUITHDRAFT_162274 [Guillardia theta CCMP2712]|uniref:RanBP2-type domain-containing protein n=1 Tax=Guillardia theta (strain CCMP2712) TaxID=905079 RepID=L1JKK8_GUITC|nr:hypothetical protein GUITHDRAFT_162274 [Guillardia theta CCMP2712]EKX48669.1 hypothetical protein GUITHDRAFT_162274 [Guillardia theta CCMP2712]|eukprot:XP_005835649.1 hypothetical protein GUITHDRAFT_162274 [Guillardia theta CCMP2712]
MRRGNRCMQMSDRGRDRDSGRSSPETSTVPAGFSRRSRSPASPRGDEGDSGRNGEEGKDQASWKDDTSKRDNNEDERRLERRSDVPSTGGGYLANQVSLPPGKFAGDWACPRCFATVFASKRECYKCRTPRPAESGGGGAGGPPPEHPGASFQVPRPGDWQCPGCGSNVFASKMICYKCRTPKPEGASSQAYYEDSTGKFARRDGDWTCPNCFSNVFATRAECYKCRTPKPGGMGYGDGRVSFGGRAYDIHPPLHTSRPGDWICPQCSAQVYASRHECFKCRTPRPPAPVPAHGYSYDYYARAGAYAGYGGYGAPAAGQWAGYGYGVPGQDAGHPGVAMHPGAGYGANPDVK